MMRKIHFDIIVPLHSQWQNEPNVKTYFKLKVADDSSLGTNIIIIYNLSRFLIGPTIII
jgi:hypothetical protein